MVAVPTGVKIVFGLLVLLGAAVIAASIPAYFADDLAPFVIEKLPLPMEDVWIFALKAHVVAAVFSLPACIALQWRLPRRAHRWLGRVTGLAVLCVLAPSGFYLALFAKGGVLGTLGFVLSAVITVVAMIRAVQHARARRYPAHRRAAWHVVAQLSVAVTSRAMLIAFDAAAVDEELAYLVALWVPVVFGAVLVELLLPKTRRSYVAAHALVAAHR